MFGDRCLGLPGCGHSTNWTCPCTCDEEIERRDRAPVTSPTKLSQQAEIERLKTQIEGLVRYVQHETGCHANEFDYLDKSPCTCGLHKFYSPKGTAPVAGADASPSAKEG
jgi:hypothetical protein